MPTLRITPADGAEAEVWSLAREVAGLLTGLPWILIGGLMVRIIEAEHGVTTEQTTGDVDAVLDIRAMSSATEEASRRLMAVGFEPKRDDSLVFRFVRGHDIVDVLAPDNLGERARLTTVPPDSTMEALGSRQALLRGRTVTVDAGDGPFELPVPSLVGAIVIKARVVGSVQNRNTRRKHERDLARLLAVVDDPVAVLAELTGRERGYMRQRAELVDAAHLAWRRVPGAENGIVALSILIDEAQIGSLKGSGSPLLECTGAGDTQPVTGARQALDTSGTDREQLDRRELADKVAWEGGVFANLRYGIRSEDIEDENLRALWAEMERHYRAITPIAVRIAAALEECAA